MILENALTQETKMWEAAKNRDLEGTFHITTTWKNYEGNWKVVFNMDQRIDEQ